MRQDSERLFSIYHCCWVAGEISLDIRVKPRMISGQCAVRNLRIADLKFKEFGFEDHN
jgi:hypothetical protein